MPKQKTHKGAAKRFKVTGSGKLRRRRSGRQHLKLAKGKNTYSRLKGEAPVSEADRKTVKRLLGT